MQNSKKQNRKQRRARRFAPEKVTSPIDNVPNTIMGRSVMRYVHSNAVTDDAFTSTNLLSMVCAGATTNSVRPIFAAVRIRKIVLYAPPETSSVLSHLACEWLCQHAPRVNHTIVAAGTLPAKLVSFPPAHSIASWWWSVGDASENLVIIDAPADGIMDIFFDFRLCSGETPTLVTQGTANTVGDIYYPVQASVWTPLDHALPAIEEGVVNKWRPNRNSSHTVLLKEAAQEHKVSCVPIGEATDSWADIAEEDDEILRRKRVYERIDRILSGQDKDSGPATSSSHSNQVLKSG